MRSLLKVIKMMLLVFLDLLSALDIILMVIEFRVGSLDLKITSLLGHVSYIISQIR